MRDRKIHEYPHGARSAVAVFLAAALASWPARAQSPVPAPPAPPSAPAPPAGPMAPPQPNAPAPPPPVDPWVPGPRAGVPSPPPTGASPAVGGTAWPAYPSPYQSSAVWPYQAPMPNPYAAGGVYVEVRTASHNVRIDRVITPGNTMTVCFAPCRQVLPRNSIYVIGGEGVRSTSQFILPDDRDRVTLDVKAGSRGETVGGVALLIGGIVAFDVGGALLIGDAEPRGPVNDPNSTTRNNSGTVMTVGGILVLGGILVGLLGLYLVLDARTKVTSSTGSQFSRTPAPPRKHARFALTPRGLEF